MANKYSGIIELHNIDADKQIQPCTYDFLPLEIDNRLGLILRPHSGNKKGNNYKDYYATRD